MTRVAVTGHRRLVVTEGLERAIDGALGRIGSAFALPLTLVSPLAEGADQIVVERAQRLGHRGLVVPLPLPQQAYLATFASREARLKFASLFALADNIVFVGPVPTVEDAYLAVGRWVLDHADVLVAVWDGHPARGAGGTGSIVEEARARAMPLAWVHAHHHSNGSRSTVSAPQQAFATFERF